MAFSPVRLNHAVLFVADLERSVRFYGEAFGMEVVAREARANAAFPRLPRSGNHHDLGLFGVGTASGPKSRGAIGLYHLAWQLDTVDELADARQRLLEFGAYTGESSHGATKSVYGADPDGTSWRSCGCFPAGSGASTRPPPRSTTSTWQPRSHGGQAYGPPVASPRSRSRRRADEWHSHRRHGCHGPPG